MLVRALIAAAAVLLAVPGTALAARPALVARELSVSRGSGAVSAARFDLVGMHWQGRGDVRFRTRSLDGTWSAWQSATAGEDDQPDRGTAETNGLRGWRIGSPFWTGGANAIQYRAVGRVSALKAFLVRPGGPAVRPRPVAVADEPAIITRSEWHADESIRHSPPWYAPAVRYAIVHHTAGSNSYSASQSASIVRAIEIYHVRANGWHDIGYNFLVDRYGQIFEGRYGGMERAVVGAHAQGFNYGSVGVAVIGSYDSAPISSAARRALIRLLAWRLDVAHIDPLSTVTAVSTGNPRYPRGRAVKLRAISGHRDAYPTDCPGNDLYAQLPAIARAVAATGLPKLYSPVVSGTVGGPVRFRARVSAAMPWTVTVTDPDGVVVATGTGSGTAVDWTWDSTGATGAYAYEIDAGPDARPVTGSIGGTVAQVRIDELRASPKLVSPNGDRRGDTARISYRLAARATVTATLADAAGTPLGTLFTGTRTAGLHAFVWQDVGVPDGRYRIVLTARRSGGKEVSAYVAITVDRTLGASRADRTAFSPNGDGRFDSAQISFTLFGPADVELRVLRSRRIVATLPQGRLGTGPQSVVWNGSGLPDGSYSVLVRAVDPVATVVQRLDLRIDTKPPQLRLVSARRLRFWINEAATVTIIVDGDHVVHDVRRGVFVIRHSRPRHSLRAVATDAAGNQSGLLPRRH